MPPPVQGGQESGGFDLNSCPAYGLTQRGQESGDIDLNPCPAYGSVQREDDIGVGGPIQDTYYRY